MFDATWPVVLCHREQETSTPPCRRPRQAPGESHPKPRHSTARNWGQCQLALPTRPLTTAWRGAGLSGPHGPAPPRGRITSGPASSQSKRGSSGCSHREHREEKGNVCRPLVTASVTGSQRPAPPVPGAAAGTPGPAPHPLPGLPQPCPRPKLPSAGPPPEPTEVPEHCVAAAPAGTAEGSPFFPNLFLAGGHSLWCPGLRQAGTRRPRGGRLRELRAAWGTRSCAPGQRARPPSSLGESPEQAGRV